MRTRYLGLLHYARRVAWLEKAVADLVEAAERDGYVEEEYVDRLIAARNRLGEVVSVDPPTADLKALQPFLSGSGVSRLMLTGRQLEAFRAVVRWIHGFTRI